jgi:hypothetical protein
MLIIKEPEFFRVDAELNAALLLIRIHVIITLNHTEVSLSQDCFRVLNLANNIIPSYAFIV